MADGRTSRGPPCSCARAPRVHCRYPCKLGGLDIHEYSRIFMDNGYFRILFIHIRGYSWKFMNVQKCSKNIRAGRIFSNACQIYSHISVIHEYSRIFTDVFADNHEYSLNIFDSKISNEYSRTFVNIYRSNICEYI